MWLVEAVDRSNEDISSMSFVTFNVAAIFFQGHPYIWRTTVRHDIHHDLADQHTVKI